MIRPMAAAVLALAAALFVAAPGWAHSLHIFATFDGTRVVGEAYFSGGIKARNVEVQAFDASEKILATVRTDASGVFAFESLPAVDIELVADAGDGHVASFRLSAAEMKGASSGPAAGQESAAMVPAAELERIVDRVVAERLAPLRREIAAYEARIRLHDVLGGIGYLVGIGGLAFWWLARREARRRER